MKKFRLTAILITLIMCFSAVGANAAAVKEVVPFTDFSTAPALYAAGGVFITNSSTKFTDGAMTISSQKWATPTGILLRNLDEEYETQKYKKNNTLYQSLFRSYTQVLSMDITVKSAGTTADSATAYMTLMGARSDGKNATPNLNDLVSTLIAAAKGNSDNTWKLMLNTTQSCKRNKTALSDISDFTVPTGCESLAYGEYVNVKIVFGHNAAKGHDYMTFYINNEFYGVEADSAVPGTGSYNKDNKENAGDTYRISQMSGIRFRLPAVAEANAGNIVIGIDNLSWLAYEGTYDAALSASADDITVTDGTASTTARIITPTAMPNKKTYMAVLAEYDGNGMVRCDMGKVTDAAYENTIPLSLGSADESNRFAAYVMEYDSLKPILATPKTLD